MATVITGLNHVNIDTDDLDATVSFYESVLGLVPGAKPSGNPGMWMHCDDVAVVHINVVPQRASSTTGNFNHVAFDATDLDGTIIRLDALAVDYRRSDRPDLALTS